MNKKQKILFLKGLPASGKSTISKNLVAQPHTNWVRINKDDLRAMLFNGKYSTGRENFVLKVRDSIIHDAISKNRDIIIDDTNFHPKHYKEIKEITDAHKLSLEVRFVDTPLEECIHRDSLRENPVGEHVIRGMYNEYLK